MNSSETLAKKVTDICRIAQWLTQVLITLHLACIKQLMEGKSMNNRFSQNIPNLGGVQPSSANSATESAEELANGDRQSLIGRNNECVICMDNQRGALRSRCILPKAFNLFFTLSNHHLT